MTCRPRLTSLGLFALNSWLVWESRASVPVATGKPSFTVKLNFVLDWMKK